MPSTFSIASHSTFAHTIKEIQRYRTDECKITWFAEEYQRRYVQKWFKIVYWAKKPNCLLSKKTKWQMSTYLVHWKIIAFGDFLVKLFDTATKEKKCEFSIENLRWIQFKKKKKITGSQILNQSGCHAPIDSGTRAAASINLYRYVVVALFSR